MNLKEMSITELKALAYDHLAEMENAQRAIGLINQEMARRNVQSMPVDAQEKRDVE